MEGIRVTDHSAFAQFVREGPVAKHKAAALRRKTRKVARSSDVIGPNAIRSTKAEARQGVLFSGMDCLPGQLDLFQTDGKPESMNVARDTAEE